MSKEDLAERINYIRECLGEDVLINEFINYLSSDELEDMVDSVERCWDIK